MNQLLKRAFAAVQALPPEEQEEIARLMLDIADDDTPEATDAAHLPDILESLEQLRRGELASEKDVEAAFKRFER